jgi:single-strand DNA-binding protein
MFNNVTLIGYLRSDAEFRTTRNNTVLTVLSLATKRTWKNRETGERESQTTWHKCVFIWSRTDFSSGFSF